MEKQMPSYLRVDLPTGDWLLRPSPGTLQIPTGDLDITLIPRSPRYTKRQKARRRRKKGIDSDMFRENLTFEEEMEEKRQFIKEEADQKLWNKVIDDQRNKKMKEIHNEKHQTVGTNIVDNNIIKIVDNIPKSDTPGKRFLKDLNNKDVFIKNNKELDAKIQSYRVVFDKSMKKSPSSPSSPKSSIKSPRAIMNKRKSDYQVHQHQNNNYFDDLVQNDINNNDVDGTDNYVTSIKSALASKLLAFKYCIEFKREVQTRLKLLKLMGNWGCKTHAVILVQRVFRRKIQRIRQRSTEKIRKFIIYWLYKTQKKQIRNGALLVKQFLKDIMEQASIIFAVKKFQYKVKKCQKVVREYLCVVKTRLQCLRKILDRLEKNSIAALCEEYQEVKIALQSEILAVYKFYQSECLKKRYDWKTRRKNKLLSWNMIIDEDDVKKYLIDSMDPQFVLKNNEKEETYPSMVVFSSRALKTKLVEALDNAKACIVVIHTQVKKKVIKKKDTDYGEYSPQELVVKVDKYLASQKK